jgi:hypothetical protein
LQPAAEDEQSPLLVSTAAQLMAALQPANAGRRIELAAGEYAVDRPLLVPDGATLVSLGPSGLIVEVDTTGQIRWLYDMTADTGIDRGWIAGISVLANGQRIR